MINMAMKAEKAEGKSAECCCMAPCSCDSDKPRYPWGLQLNIEKEQIEALGILTMPKVGETMTLQATVKVTRCSEEEREGAEPDRSISLQITDMGLEMPEMKRAPMDKAAVASALYGKAEG